ncbi:hypothetical protein Anapl_12714, partial [Anas platyrhynchos]
VSVGQLDQLKGCPDSVLAEAGPHRLPIVYGPDSPADLRH